MVGGVPLEAKGSLREAKSRIRVERSRVESMGAEWSRVGPSRAESSRTGSVSVARVVGRAARDAARRRGGGGTAASPGEGRGGGA